jgi:gas vesicle protein
MSNKESLNGQVWVNVAAGIAIGLVIGGTLALLFAPKSGEQTRKEIGDALEDLKDKAEQVIDDLQVTTAELIDRSQALLEETRENVARSVEAGKEAYTQKKEELMAQLDA